jgi:hypothetical protein
MHGSVPKIMIIAKREAAGDLMPDFSGPSFQEARKSCVHGESEMVDPVGDEDEDMNEQILAIAKELLKASKMHKGQSEKLKAIVGGENAQYSAHAEDEGEEEMKIGKKRELK